MPANPCLTCGACCAFFRASFYWAESDEAAPGGVPAGLTRRRGPFLLEMKGMRGPRPRCVALRGTIGREVHCAIYENRSSVCRDFEFSWATGSPNERCDKARKHWGLEPLASPAGT